MIHTYYKIIFTRYNKEDITLPKQISRKGLKISSAVFECRKFEAFGFIFMDISTASFNKTPLICHPKTFRKNQHYIKTNFESEPQTSVRSNSSCLFSQKQDHHSILGEDITTRRRLPPMATLQIQGAVVIAKHSGFGTQSLHCFLSIQRVRFLGRPSTSRT